MTVADTRPNVIVPPRLSEARLTHPVTMVVAPAGFGKTSLVRQWRSRMTVPNTSVRVDGLMDPQSAMDVGEALARAFGKLSGLDPAPLIDLLPTVGPSLGEEFLRALVEIAVELPEFVLAIEDLNGLAPETMTELGRFLRRVGSDRHRFIVTGRRLPAWPVRRWRLAGFAIIVGAAQLRLRDSEVRAALTPLFGEATAELLRLCAGWPAALQTILWHAESRSAVVPRAVTNDLADYIGEELLPLLPVAELEVLARVSVLEPFPLSVAVAMVGESASGALTSMMRRTGLVDVANPKRITIHPILKEAALRWAREQGPGVEAEFHALAGSAWLEQLSVPDRFSHAMVHLVRAAAWPQALELLRERWDEFELQARLDRVVDWLDRIPAVSWQTDPGLAPLYVMASLRLGRTVSAMSVARRVQAHGDLEHSALVSLAIASGVGWDVSPDFALRECAKAKAVVTAQAPGPPGFVVFPGVADQKLAYELCTAQALVIGGEFRAAEGRYRELLDQSLDMGPLTQVVAWSGFSLSLAMLGDLTGAEYWARSALTLAQDLGSPLHMRTSLARMAQVVSAALQGDPGAALGLLEQVAQACRPSRAANLLRFCDLVAALCEVDERFVDSVEPPLLGPPLKLTQQFLKARSARRMARLGQHVGAQLELAEIEPHELTVASWTEVALLTRGRSSAQRWLASVPAPSTPHGEVIRQFAEAATTDDAPSVVPKTEAALELVQATGLAHALLDSPRPLWTRSMIVNSTSASVIEARHRIAAHEAGEVPSLTERERDIVHLLPTPLSTAELAERLFVSVHTVKWHRANLYRKLGAKTREEAVDRARELGLIG